MSADGDTVREALWPAHVHEEALAALARLEAAETQSRDLMSALDALAGEPAMLDRLRACEERGQNLVDGIGMEREMRKDAEAQRDEWQRRHEATWVRLPKSVQTIYMREYRAALAEAGLG